MIFSEDGENEASNIDIFWTRQFRNEHTERSDNILLGIAAIAMRQISGAWHSSGSQGLFRLRCSSHTSNSAFKLQNNATETDGIIYLVNSASR